MLDRVRTESRYISGERDISPCMHEYYTPILLLCTVTTVCYLASAKALGLHASSRGTSFYMSIYTTLTPTSPSPKTEFAGDLGSRDAHAGRQVLDYSRALPLPLSTVEVWGA